MTLLSTGTFKGVVKSVQVTGYGANSGEIVVVISGATGDQTYCVLSDTEPMVFTAYVRMLMDAFQKKATIDVSYALMAGQTALLSGIIFS